MSSNSLAARSYDENADLQPWIIATTVAITLLALLTVGLRFLARWIRAAPLGADDYLILSSMGLLFVVFGFVMGMTHYGMGLHASTLKTTDVVMVAKFLMVAEILYVINLALTKLSILLMYYRIFPSRSFKLWAYGIGSFVIAWVITIVFVFIFICVPVQKMWYTDLPGHCVNQVGTWIANATSTIASDVAILILPMPRVWKLQTGLVQRISLIVMFGVGFFIVFTSAYRFSVLFKYSALDASWTLSRVVVWTIIEIAAGIISACLPTLRPVLKLVLKKFSVITTSVRDTTQAQTGSKTTAGLSVPATNASTHGGPFQRLEDSRLRPEHGGKISSTAMSRRMESNNDNSSLSEDEIPLQKIHVRTEVNWSESN